MYAHFFGSIRELVRRPVATATAIATLAVGIGAVTAVFSVVDAVLLRPLPYAEPQRLVSIWTTVDRGGETERWRVTGATFSDWRDPRHGLDATFDSMAAFGAWGGTLTGRGEPVALRGASVTTGYFETLGVVPAAGRFFASGSSSSGERLAVVSHRLATERLGGVESAVGERLVVDGESLTVIGVAPPAVYPSWPVNGPRMQFRAEYHDLFLPMSPERLANRRSHLYGVVARLAPDANLESARGALDLVSRRLGTEHSEEEGEGAVVRPLVDEAVGDVRAALTLLLAAAGLLLGVACASVGGLVVARAAERRHEIALRRALGAGGGALARRFLSEAALVASAGAAGGVALASLGVKLLLARVPREIPRLDDAAIDLRAVACSAALALVATALFALLPLMLQGRLEVADALRDSLRGGGAGHGRQRLRSLLVTAQISLAVLLGIGTVLLGESYRRLIAVEPGVATSDVLAVSLELDAGRYPDLESVSSFGDRLLESVRSLAGVSSAQLAYDHPLESNWINGFAIEGQVEDPARPWTSDLRFVTPGYFDDLDVALDSGREFEARASVSGAGSAIVDRAFVRRFFGGGDPLGATIATSVGRWSWGETAPARFEIVGVVDDIAPPEPGSEAQPTLYLDLRQVPQRAFVLLVRVAGSPGTALAPVRERIRELDPSLPIVRARTLEAERRRAIAQPRFSLELIGLFGTLALGFSALGVYGLLATWVAARRQEIGVRLALGAGRAQVVRLVAFHGARLTLAGVALGCLAAFTVARLVESQLHGVSAFDPGAYAVASIVVLAAAGLAALLPTLAAAATDPAVALRDE